MRKIIFRGKRKNNGEWVESDSIQNNPFGKTYLMDANRLVECYNKEIMPNGIWIEVHPETVGQFIGLTDKNGEEIYEGDIIEDNNGIGVVMWFQTAWGVASYAHGYDGLKSYTAVDSFYSNETKEWTVIGNIHDNPELLTNKE